MKPEEVRALRARLGLTRERMAERLGVSANQYAELENGTSPMRRLVENALRWIAHAAGDDGAGDDACATCEGTGTVSRPPLPGRRARRSRMTCSACEGSGYADPARQAAA